jgi:hypothetical protein
MILSITLLNAFKFFVENKTTVLSLIKLSDVMCRRAECRHTECHHAECRNSECNYTECRAALRHKKLGNLIFGSFLPNRPMAARGFHLFFFAAKKLDQIISCFSGLPFSSASTTSSRGQCYKTSYIHNLQLFIIS